MRFAASVPAAAAAFAAFGCAGPRPDGERSREPRAGHAAGRISARPSPPPPARRREPGVHELPAGGGRRALLSVPAQASSGRRVPLLVILHGAGGAGEEMLRLVRGPAGEAGFAVLAPSSRGSTWDVVRGGFGPDVEALDDLLGRVFARVAVDPERVVVGGFSDGASYALSLGLTNGDLFTHVVAFSPGFSAARARVGRPAVFVSHGTDDDVLPIDRTSRRVVPDLRRRGYAVRYREFAGGHVVPPQVTREALGWVRAGRADPAG